MKKILLAILTILLMLLAYIILTKSISVAGLKIESIAHIKNSSQVLEQEMQNANTLVDKEYPNKKASLEQAIKSLKIAKQEYESKNIHNADESELGAVQIDTYKIHFLWTRLGNYRKDRGVKSLSLDLKSTETSDVYDLQFTLIGSYSNIIEFLYDIENDEDLNFEPRNFAITSNILSEPIVEEETNTIGSTNPFGNKNTIDNSATNKNTTNNNTVTTTSTTVKNDGINLKATFTVKNVGITLD